MKTVRIAVREEVVSRQLIEFEAADDLDLADEDAVNAAAEEAYTSNDYRYVANTNQMDVGQRMYFDPEVVPAEPVPPCRVCRLAGHKLQCLLRTDGQLILSATRDPVPRSVDECEFGDEEYQWRLRQAGI